MRARAGSSKGGSKRKGAGAKNKGASATRRGRSGAPPPPLDDGGAFDVDDVSYGDYFPQGIVEPFDAQPMVEAEPLHPKHVDLNGSQAARGMPPREAYPDDAPLAPAPNYNLAQYIKPLPKVLLVHTGGTLGMDPGESYSEDVVGHVQLKEGTGGVYPKTDHLQPGAVLSDLLTAVPELENFAVLDVEIPFNVDSCRIGPRQWIQLAKLLDKKRPHYDAFMVVHGTDTMVFTAAALSLMLAGFKKPIVMTGSQLPLAMPRSDARQNLIDAITTATAGVAGNNFATHRMGYPVRLEEVAICFGGKLLRGNRARKSHSSVYQAFDSPTYPYLAELGVEVEFDHSSLLHAAHDVYTPRFKLNSSVIRIPIVPGVDPRKAYGDIYERGVRGIVLEAFGVGNMPDNPSHGWLPWLKQQRKKGLQVYLCSQCQAGNLNPELYRSGSVALNMGVESGRQMTPECAVIKMMFCLEYPDIPLSQPIAGEL